MVTYNQYPKTHVEETADVENTEDLKYEEKRYVAELVDVDRKFLVDAFTDPGAEVELQDGNKKKFYDILKDISDSYEYSESGYSVSGTAKSLNDENVEDSPLVRMIQIVLNGMTSEGSLGIYAFKNYAGSSLGRSKGAGLLDEDGWLGQHTLEAINSYLNVVDVTTPDVPVLGKTTMTVKEKSTDVVRRIESPDKEILEANATSNFDIYRTDAKGETITLVDFTVADANERATIYSLLGNVLDNAYYDELKTVLKKLETKFTGIEIYGRRLRKIKVPDGVLTEEDKLVFEKYEVTVDDGVEVVSEDFDEAKFKASVVANYTKLNGTEININNITIEEDGVNKSDKKVTVKIGEYSLVFSYEDETYEATLESKQLDGDVDYFDVVLTGTEITLENVCLKSLNDLYEEIQVDGVTATKFSDIDIEVQNPVGDKREFIIGDYAITFNYDVDSRKVIGIDTVNYSKSATAYYRVSVDVDDAKQIDLVKVPLLKRKLFKKDGTEVIDVIFLKDAMDLIVNSNVTVGSEAVSNMNFDFKELEVDKAVVPNKIIKMEVDLDATKSGKMFEFLEKLDISNAKQVKKLGKSRGYEKVEKLFIENGKIIKIVAKYDRVKAPTLKELSDAGIEEVKVTKIYIHDGISSSVSITNDWTKISDVLIQVNNGGGSKKNYEVKYVNGEGQVLDYVDVDVDYGETDVLTKKTVESGIKNKFVKVDFDTLVLDDSLKPNIITNFTTRDMKSASAEFCFDLLDLLAMNVDDVKDWGGTGGYRKITDLNFVNEKISYLSAKRTVGQPSLEMIENAEIISLYVGTIKKVDGSLETVNGKKTLIEIYELVGDKDKATVKYDNGNITW